MNSKQQQSVKATAARNGALDSHYGPYQIAPNGDKITVEGNKTQIGTKVFYGEKSAKDALNKMGGK